MSTGRIGSASDAALVLANVSDVTASADEVNILDGATLTVTELNYVDGVTSAIQTQLDAKAPLASPTFTGTVTLPVGLTGVIRTDTGVVSVDADVTDLVTAASDAAAGKVELATTAETTTGTDATRAVTPDGLHDMTSLAGAAWFLDEDDMVSNSATKTVSQQSLKAYVDTADALKADDSAVVHDTGAESIDGVKTFTSDPIIPDEAYGVGWNGVLEPATKNAIYDKIETMGGGVTLEQVYDALGDSVLVAGNNIDITHVDGSDTITIDVETLTLADISDVTASITEVNYIDGVTSAIQDQLDAKQPLDADLTTLSTAFATASGTAAASLALHEDTDNGTNKVTLIAPASVASDKTQTLQDITGTVYVSTGADVALADGGTGASLADPGADRVMFWDDSAGATTWLTMGSNLTITDTTLDAGAGASIAIEENNVSVGSFATLDFDGSDFTITDETGGEALIQLAYGTSAGTPAEGNHTHLLAAGATDVTASSAELNILDGATLTVTELNYVDGVTSAIQTQLDARQDEDATLTALAAYNTNGLLTQTAADTFAGRTITGTANKITVSDGNGVSGNPTITIPDTPTLVTPTIASFTNATHGHTDAASGGALSLTQSVAMLFGNGTDVITVGETRRFRIPVAHTLVRWSIWSSVSGSIVFRVSRDTWANMPTTTADEVSTSRPTLSATTHNEDSSITDWTSEVGGAGDAYLVDVISVTSCVDVTLELWYTRGIA
jgi:hypothetical protein